MESITNKINKTFLKTILMVGIFTLSFLITDSVLAAPQLRVRNDTNKTFSDGGTLTPPQYASSTRAKPGDTLEFQMFGNNTPATSFNVTLPADLTYVSTSSYSTGGTASISAVGQTITWAFASNNYAVIRFTVTVASGATLSTTHTHNLTYTTNTAVTSDTATVKTGPVLKTISPSSGGDFTATNLTLTGHGFTQVADITSLALSDSTNIVQSLNVSGPDGSGYYTITGARVPSGKTLGAYYVILSTTIDGNVLTTEANTNETVTYTVTDGTAPLMSVANSYVHSTGILTLTFNETIDVSATDLSKITLYDASNGGTLSQVLTGATVSTADSTTVTITLTQAQKNAVSAAGVTASNLYIQIAGSGIYDMSNNSTAAQGSRTAFTTWTKDTIQPTATLVYTQNGATTTSVKAGSVTITATFSEPISATPNIAIDQPGTTDIAATAMTLPAGGDRTTWTYTYTLNATADGTATVTLSNAPDYANNALSTVTGNTFTLDTLPPSPAISTLAAPTSSPTEIALTWTPTYTESDFSTYKIYYGTSSGVSSSNGTLINVSGSGTNSFTVSNLPSGTTYYFVIYICDQAANCSNKSNEVTRGTSPTGAIIPPSGGSVGATAPSSPSVASSSGTISSTGGTITTTLPGGSSATVSVPTNTFSDSTSIAVNEATSSEKQAAPITSNVGAIVGNTVFNIQASASGTMVTNFSNAITLSFTYDLSQLGAIDPTTLRLAYFNISTNTWTPLDSTVDVANRKVTAQTNHFTLFALVSFVNPPITSSPPPTTEPTAETGQILGFSVGVYPNGTLLKAPNSSAVWYIAGGHKHVIPSSAVFQSRWNWADIVYLPSSRQLDLYERGEDVKFATNTLVKESGASSVYRVSATGGLQPILSLDVFLKRSYRTSDIVEVDAGALASYPREAYITDPNIIYSGELVAVPQKGVLAPVYYIEAGQARGIPNRGIFDQYAFKLKQIRAITASQLKTFGMASNLLYPDGTLLKGSKSTVYIISDGQKRAFNSGLDLDALLYNRKRIRQVTDSVLASFPDASQIRLVQKNIHTANSN